MGNAREVWDFFLQCLIAIVYSLYLSVSFIILYIDVILELTIFIVGFCLCQ